MGLGEWALLFGRGCDKYNLYLNTVINSNIDVILDFGMVISTFDRCQRRETNMMKNLIGCERQT